MGALAILTLERCHILVAYKHLGVYYIIFIYQISSTYVHDLFRTISFGIIFLSDSECCWKISDGKWVSCCVCPNI